MSVVSTRPSFLVALAMVAMTGCSQPLTYSYPAEAPRTISVAWVTTPPGRMELGQSIKLDVVVTGTTNRVVRWESSDQLRVGLPDSGVATCKASGFVTLTARSAEDYRAAAYAWVTCGPPIQMLTVTPAALSFTHVVDASPCPQVIGTVKVSNAYATTVAVAMIATGPLTFDTGVQFKLRPGETRDVVVSYSCAPWHSGVSIYFSSNSEPNIQFGADVVLTVAGTITK